MDICPSKYLFFSGSDDPNVLWADWKTKFLDVVNFHVPLRTRRTKIKKAPWINSELKKGMRDRDAAKRKAMASNDPRGLGKVQKVAKIKETIITLRLLKHLTILMLLVNLKVILEKHGKPLTNLLPVAPTIQR